MASELLMKVAAVLDAIALDKDKSETAKLASEKSSRETKLKQLQDRYAAVSGEDLPEETLAKLAGYDETQLDVAIKLVEKRASAVDSMGGPSERSDGHEPPKNKKEAAQQAYDNFGKYLTS